MTAPKKVPEKTTNQLVVEEWLESFSVDWDYKPAFAMSKIDLKESVRNQARLDNPLDEDRVELIAEGIENGDKIPPVVGYLKNNKLILIDGNHRVNAWELCGSKTVPVYVVKEANVEVLTEMTYQANAKHPTPNTQEERIQHAIFMVQQGRSQIDAAGTMNVKVLELQRAWAKTEVERRALAVGVSIREWSKVSVSSKVRINALKNDDVFAKCVTVVSEIKLPTEEVSKLVADVNRKRTNESQLALLDSFRKDHREEIKKNRSGTRSLSYMVSTHSSGLIATLNREDFYDTLTPAQAQDYSVKLGEVISEAAVAQNKLRSYV